MRKNAVPSVFNFPSHLQKQVTTPRREIKRTLLNETPPLPNETPVIKKSRSPSKEDLRADIVRLKREVKTLKQKVKRKVSKVGALANIIDDLKERSLLDDTTD